MYNRYQGNSGRVERVEDAAGFRPGAAPQAAQAARGAPAAPAAGERRPPSPLSGLSGELSRLLKRLSGAGLETEDFLLIFILYLLYRESGDEEFLFAIGGLLLF